MRSVLTGEALRIFHAVSTRDGEAQARDGHSIYASNAKGTDSTGDLVFEIEFADGFWMLATATDIELPKCPCAPRTVPR